MRSFAVFLLLPMAFATNAKPHTMTLATASVKVEAFSEMEKVFGRSQETHQQSMNAISKNMDLPKAMGVIQHSTLSNSESMMAKVTSLIGGSQHLRSAKDDGFGGLDGAH